MSVQLLCKMKLPSATLFPRQANVSGVGHSEATLFPLQANVSFGVVRSGIATSSSHGQLCMRRKISDNLSGGKSVCCAIIAG